MSTFDGFIKEINWISVDRFEKENSLNSTTFFLSHCHTDHMNGLKSREFRKALNSQNDYYLYCSKITAHILKNLGYDSLMNKIRILDIMSPTSVDIPEIDCEGRPREVVVTLLPAGHCPGSVMFLFETTNETILYTGDFRFSDKEVSQFKHLHHKDGAVKKLSSVYIDTTFWSQPIELFPSRQESLQLIIHQIEKWNLEQNDGHVHIDRPARIGSEFIIIALAKRFKTRVHVNPSSYQLYQGIYELEDSITLDPTSTKIHMCANFAPGRTGRSLKCLPSYRQTLYIRPTAQWYACGAEFLPIKCHKSKSFVQISLSMHASRRELVTILQYLKPKKVVACVVPSHMSQEQIDEELNSAIHISSNNLSSRPNLSVYEYEASGWHMADFHEEAYVDE